MKTIYAVFNKPETPVAEVLTSKKYSFNVDTELVRGDVISTDKYNKTIIVTDVLDRHYKFYNPSEGLKDTATGPKDFKIAEISFTGQPGMIKGKVERNIFT